MFPLKSLWKSLSSDNNRPPEKDEKMVVAESLMLELEFHIKELEALNREREQEERRKQTGVDYSWLVSVPQKTYNIPQLERLELEELCYSVKPSECGRVISLLRDAVLNEPKVNELPRILQACIRQVVDQRPKEDSLADWVAKRTVSLTNLKFRPQSRVMPVTEEEDVEGQVVEEQEHRGRSRTLPDFTSKVDSLPV